MVPIWVEPNDYRFIVTGSIPEDNQAIVGLTKLHLVTFMGAVAIAVVLTCLLELVTIKLQIILSVSLLPVQ